MDRTQNLLGRNRRNDPRLPDPHHLRRAQALLLRNGTAEHRAAAGLGVEHQEIILRGPPDDEEQHLQTTELAGDVPLITTITIIIAQDAAATTTGPVPGDGAPALEGRDAGGGPDVGEPGRDGVYVLVSRGQQQQQKHNAQDVAVVAGCFVS